MLERSPKRRHELRADKIRALYGHSTPARIVRHAEAPPEVLYHGTDATRASQILQDGLKPMRRQYVHLSADQETAYQVGKRKAADPVVLVVRAGDAHRAGVRFYEGSGSVWLADFVPPRFINWPSG
jgi:putative RNA 2'-phosphotransferase